MKALIRFTWFLFLFGLAVFPAQAAFTSLYIFGDGVSTTTTNHPPSDAQFYYGGRNSNGRLWVEILAQQLDLTNNYWYSNNSSIHLSYTNLSAYSTNWSYSSNNQSFFGNYSTVLATNIGKFIAPADASNALFIVWVADADFVGYMNNTSFGPPYTSNNIAIWTNAINQSISNHFIVITNLYAKGARALLMPNAVDITEIPEYNQLGSANKSFVRQRVIGFNSAFVMMLSNAMVLYPDLKIYKPDTFSLLDNVLTNPAAYGVTNALSSGQSIDVIEDPSLADKSLNGPGTNYIFWDVQDPTAKVHGIMAGVARQLIAPVQISQITSQNGTNQLTLINVPMGLNGILLGSTDLTRTNWTTVASINSTNSVQPVFVPVSGPMWFYRVYFPFSWSWP